MIELITKNGSINLSKPTGGGTVTDKLIAEAVEKYMLEHPVEVDGYVPETRKIADIDLVDDITVEELQGAIGSGSATNAINEFSQTAIPKLFEWKEGGLDDKTAEETDNVYRCRTDFIEMDSAFTYYALFNNTTGTTQQLLYYVFDENKNLIGAKRTMLIEPYTQRESTIYVAGAKYIRLSIMATNKNQLIRFYCKEQIAHSTKKELKKATYGNPRSLSALDYFGANKKVVLVGDSFTQGLGSSEYVMYYETDEDGNQITITGNSPAYGVEHNLPHYEIGKKLYTLGSKVWYESIDGNGYSHRLKNYLLNKYGCTVKNYGMSGITSGTLLSQAMNASNSDLVEAGNTTEVLFNTQESWEYGDINLDGTLSSSTKAIRAVDYIDLTKYVSVTVSTSDTTIPFRVAYYNNNNEFIAFNSGWVRGSLTLDKTVGTKALIKVLTTDIANFNKITVTAEKSGDVRVIEGVVKGFDTVFLTIGGNDRGFEDYVAPSTGQVITGKELYRSNLRKLASYILGEGKKLILMSMTPCADDSEKNVPMWDIDEVIGDIAKEFNVPFVSNYKGMLDYCEATGIDINTLRNRDGLHPNDEGYAVIEAMICDSLGILEIDKNYVDNLFNSIINGNEVAY